MKRWTAPLALFALVVAGEGRAAQPLAPAIYAVPDAADEGDELPYLQCVPYARQVSGIQIYGDAWTWWDQADGRYERGYRPKVGAVMSFRPYGNMRLGHVAAVSRVIDSRTVLLRHANWSLIDGRRGQIENDVRAVDVSAAGDWSEVRVWFAPLGGLGTTHWPLNGFIYPKKVKDGKARPLAPRTTVASAAPRTPAPLAAPAARPAPAVTRTPAPVRLASAQPVSRPAPSRIGSDFLKGIRPEVPIRTAAPATRQLASAAPVRPAAAAPAATKKAPARNTAPARADDPIGRIISSRSR
jgi:surface antigen